MPEYAFSIDVYADGVDAGAQRWLYVQEYAPPATVDPAKARARREEAFAVIPETLGIARERVHLRTRRKQKGGAQYSKLGQRGEFGSGSALRATGTSWVITGEASCLPTVGGRSACCSAHGSHRWNSCFFPSVISLRQIGRAHV